MTLTDVSGGKKWGSHPASSQFTTPHSPSAYASPRLLCWGLVAVSFMTPSSHTTWKFILTCFSWQMNKIASKCKDTQDIAVNNSYPWYQHFTSLPNQSERETGAVLMVKGLKYWFNAEFTLLHSLCLILDNSAHPKCTDIYLLKSINLWLFMGTPPLKIQGI